MGRSLYAGMVLKKFKSFAFTLTVNICYIFLGPIKYVQCYLKFSKVEGRSYFYDKYLICLYVVAQIEGMI